MTIRLFLMVMVLSLSASAAEAPARVLSVLTYDSLMAEGGLGRELVSRFEKECSCTVKVQTVGDAAQMVSRLQLDAARKKYVAQVVLGMDQSMWPAVKGLASTWMPRAKFVHEVGAGFIPFDYGVMAFIWNPSGASAPPRKWRDLLDSKWKKSLLLQDPRTSSPGLGFVMGARAALGPKAAEFFGSLKTQWLTLAPGWSGSYELFLHGEAPLVWSYTTSQAYHRTKDPQARYRAIVFEDGNPLQIEGAFLVEAALPSDASRKLARDFLSLLISKEVQELVPVKQWMFPAVAGVPVPREFQELPKPAKVLATDSQVPLNQVLQEWERWIR